MRREIWIEANLKLLEENKQLKEKIKELESLLLYNKLKLQDDKTYTIFIENYSNKQVSKLYLAEIDREGE